MCADAQNSRSGSSVLQQPWQALWASERSRCRAVPLARLEISGVDDIFGEVTHSAVPMLAFDSESLERLVNSESDSFGSAFLAA